MPRTRKITVEVSSDRYASHKALLEEIQPTNENPVPGDRLFALAEAQLRVLAYKRKHYRRAGRKGRRRR